MQFTTTIMQITPFTESYTIGMQSVIQEDYVQVVGMYLVLVNGQH